MKLNGILTTLNRFISKSAHHALPFFKPLWKEENVEWTPECEEALSKLKNILA